ncbi:hypothetical protein D3C73_1081430 [compost metagenome]
MAANGVERKAIAQQIGRVDVQPRQPLQRLQRQQFQQARGAGIHVHEAALVQADSDLTADVRNIVAPWQVAPGGLALGRTRAPGHHILEADPRHELANIHEVGVRVHAQAPIRPFQAPVARGVQGGRVVSDRQLVQTPLPTALQVRPHHLKLAHILAVQKKFLGLQVDGGNVR